MNACADETWIRYADCRSRSNIAYEDVLEAVAVARDKIAGSADKHDAVSIPRNRRRKADVIGLRPVIRYRNADRRARRRIPHEDVLIAVGISAGADQVGG